MMQQKALSCQEQLENLQKEYEEFAYIVSHDLKAPLRAIHNLSGWITEDLGQHIEPEVKHNLQLLQNRTVRLERMINAILSFSRVNKTETETREVKVATLVENIAAPFQKANNLTLHLSNLPVLTTYAKKLEVVFQHLIQNAVTFNESTPPEIWISATSQPQYFQFTIKDNGIGIPAEALGKIFKLFYTVQPKDQQNNVGAGLTIVHKTLQFVGGTISVTSEKGIGTEFTFLWPITLQDQK